MIIDYYMIKSMNAERPRGTKEKLGLETNDNNTVPVCVIFITMNLI